MRRGINIRKKKKIIINKSNKKFLKIISILVIFLILCTIIYFSFIQDIFIKKNFEQDSINFSNLNDSMPFSIKRILLFSSATAESDSINQQLTLDISQYCDIGIYLNKSKNESENVTSLYIDNILITSPKVGTPYLYKKDITNLGKCSFSNENIINESFSFNLIDMEQDINLNNFEIYNDLSTPISIGFYNENIKTDFFPNKSELLYNGMLLKDAAIPTNSLKCNISFTINIITTSNKHYICNINFDVPFEDENGSIYKLGYITKEFNSNEINKFIRVK